ncbi:MAG: hypothetical protein ABS28_00830 [Cryomorphaceae bacterium BACL22 MAG-120619-bin32]|jgi:predicted lactoylglutathione lyase|nr:MAG: hypothetical protein ABS28_00830 [Cryomorphaceae bacterium BACL22 MAG-120619-bin32]
MKTIKLLLSVILFISLSNTGFSQEKVSAEAAKKVAELNKELVSVDKAAALTEKQQQEITAIYVEKSKSIKKIKKEVTDQDAQKEQIKVLNQEAGKKINGLLTKEQKAAKKTAKENKED